MEWNIDNSTNESAPNKKSWQEFTIKHQIQSAKEHLQNQFIAITTQHTYKE